VPPTKLTLDLENKLKKMTPITSEKFFGESYIGGNESRLRYLNLKIPDLRALFTNEKMSEWTLTEIENLWFTSNIFEAKTLAIIWLEKQPTEFLLKNIQKIFKWAPHIDNWALSDGYCGILARVFEADSQKVLPTYKKWNKHKNSWLRRISIVGLLYYARARKVKPTFSLVISMVKPHLRAKEYYLQKGVGWTLREAYNVYPKETTQFIVTNLSEIHSDAWYAASEKMPLKLKQKLVLERRKRRQK
jgi:3-methyladenine DNA glycosylase AlkD